MPAQAESLLLAVPSSLTEPVRDISKAYEKKHSFWSLKVTSGATGSLLQQIRNGAPVDVFISADPDHMRQAVSQNLVSDANVMNFASNDLVLITPKDNPASIHSIKDLLKETTSKIAVGTPRIVPAGSYAKSVLDNVKLWQPLQAKLVFAQNVRQVLNYVSRGEAQAGFVYATDALIMPEKVEIVSRLELKKPVSYYAGTVKSSQQPEAAADFLQYLRSTDALQILQSYGFKPPEEH